MAHKVFSVDELAEYLHVSRENIEILVRRREIPFDQQGERVIFRQKEIDAWASHRILGFSHADLNDYHNASSAKAHDLSAKHAIIPEVIQASYIEPDLKAKTKSSVIRAMVKLADQTELLNYPDDLLTAVQEREQLCSTALAGGIALLHAKNHEPYMSEDTFIVLAKTSHPVPFGSPDGRTTDIFFLLCSQDDRIHLHLLARICMMCYHTSLLLELREAQDPETMLQVLTESEAEIIKDLRIPSNT